MITILRKSHQNKLSYSEAHRAYHSGYSLYYGNFGLWQGSLNVGTHTISIEHRNNGKTTSKDTAWETRTLNIIYC